MYVQENPETINSAAALQINNSNQQHMFAGMSDVKELAPQFKVKPLPPRNFGKQFHPQQRERQQGSMAVEEEMEEDDQDNIRLMNEEYEGNHLSINGRSEEEPHQQDEDENSPRINHVVQMV